MNKLTGLITQLDLPQCTEEEEENEMKRKKSNEWKLSGFNIIHICIQNIDREERW